MNCAAERAPKPDTFDDVGALGSATATHHEAPVADPVPAGSDVSAGTYKCTNCGYELEVGSTKNLPPCPSCHNGQYDTLSGGDSASDPYPDRT